MANLDVFGGLSGIGVLAAGFGFAYAQFKSGGGKAKDDLVSTLKEQLNIEKEKTEQLKLEKDTLIQSHQKQLTEITGKLGKLEGLQEANEKKIKEYRDILQGRSPEQTQFMEFMTQVAKDSAEYMKNSSNILKDIQGSLRKIDGRVTNNEKAIIEIAKGVK